MVPTAVEISLCSGPVPESCLKSCPRLRAMSLSSSPKPPEMGLIAVLPKTFSCALEIGWFSLIILFGGHRAIAAAEVAAHRSGFGGIPGMDSMSEYLESFHPLFAWEILSLNLIPTLWPPNVSASQFWLMWQ